MSLLNKGFVVVAAVGAGLVVAGVVGGPEPPAPDQTVAWHGPRGAARPIERSEPVRIEIPPIDVKARVITSTAGKDGTIEEPPRNQPWLASWYDLSVTPGEIGASVILGHLDAAKTGPAVFYKLGKLRPGQRIRVTRRDNRIAIFRIDKIRSYDKTKLPVRQVFGPVRYAALRLITCGGTYDSDARSYRDNVVVFATMVRVERQHLF